MTWENFLPNRNISFKILHSTFFGGNESFPTQVLSSLEMALSFSPQGFAQSNIGERRLPLMSYKPLA